MAETKQFSRVVEELRVRFPGLRIHVAIEPHPHLDALADIPPQPGLDFGFSFNLQGDELHLNVGSLWVEWFPCTDAMVTAEFIEAVGGIISGQYRIVEYLIGDDVVKAQLQRPRQDGQGEKVATWADLGVFIPWLRKQNVIQNAGGGPSPVKPGDQPTA